jgi:addiction module RelE/StbE family toxin
MNVRFTETAYADLREIHAFIAKENPRAADTVIERIEATSRQIGTFPKIGPRKYRSTRMFPVGRFPYLIFYATEGNEVVILTIRHSSHFLSTGAAISSSLPGALPARRAV